MPALNKISQDLIKKYQEEISKDFSSATLKRKSISLKKFLDWAKSNGMVETSQEERKITAKTPPGRRPSGPGAAGNNKFKNWYKTYRNIPGVSYLNIAVLIILVSALGFGIYNQFFKNATRPLAYPTSLVRPNRYLSFQGRLTTASGNPVTAGTTLAFNLYTASSGGSPLWTGSCSVSPDTDGVFSTLLGSTCGTELTSDIFSQNAAIWLGVTVASDAEATPRVQIATVAYSLNSETLQGYPASSTATINTVPVINNSGQMVIALLSPKILSTAGNFAVEGQSITIDTPSGSFGNINFAPDSTGSANFQFAGASPGGGTGMLNATDANLTSGALIYGSVASNASGYNLLQLRSGSPLTDRFVVDSAGNASMSGSLTLAGGARSIQTTLFSPLTIGGATTGNIVLSPSNNTAGGNVSPSVTNVTDLGTSSILFRNIYGNNIFQGVNQVCDAAGNHCPSGSTLWQLANSVLAPGNTTYDLTIGGSATGSAFQVFGAQNAAGDVVHINSTVVATGDIIEATSSGITSGDFIHLGEGGNSAFTGNGINMDFDNTGGGGGSFTGKFLNFANAGTIKYFVDSAGNASQSGNLTLGNGSSIRPAFGPLTLSYKSGANAWTSGLTLTNSGSVGIGTTNPSVQLQVVSSSGDSVIYVGPSTVSASAGIQLIGNNSGTPNYATIYAGWNGNLLYSPAAAAGSIGHQFNKTDGSSAVVITGTGSLGIGTTTPTAILDVAGAASVSGSLSFRTGTGTIQSTTFSSLVLGGNTTGNITFSPSNDTAGGFVAPNVTNVNDLGLASKIWRNIYGTTIYQGVNQVCDAGGAVAGCSSTNYWRLASGVLSPVQAAYDLTIGGTATGSAFQVFGAQNAAGDALKLTSTVVATGNLIEATSSAITSGDMIHLGEGGNSAFTGNGINMDFDNTGGGGGAFTGKFLKFANAGTIKYFVDSAGNASQSGNLTLGNGSAIQSAFGPLTLNYKSGANTWTAGLTITNSGLTTVARDLNSSAATANLFNVTTTNLTIGGAATAITMAGASGTNITIGNSGGAAQLNLTSGTGSQTHTSSVATGTGLTGAFVFKDAALSSGDLIYATASAITSGSMLKLGQGGNTPFTGNGIFMDFNNTGGGTFSGNFLRLDSNSVDKFLASASGNLVAAGALQIGTTFAPPAFTRFSTSNVGTTHSLSTAQDVLINGAEELNGVLYLNGRNISSSNGTSTITFPSDPTASNAFNLLTNGSWKVQNPTTGNPGLAALIVDQLAVADIFTASASGVAKMTLNNAGNLGIGQTIPSSRLDVVGSSSVAIVGVSNLLTADGTFGTSSGWTGGGGPSWTIGSGVVTHTTGQTGTLSGTSTATSTGHVYQINFTTTASTPGDGFTVSLGGTDSGNTITTAGAQTVYVNPGAGTGTLLFTPGAAGTFVGTIDNVTIYDISRSTQDVLVENSNGTNTPIGISAGGDNLYNAFIGSNTGIFNTTGSGNDAFGAGSLRYNTTGSANNGFGAWTLLANTTGQQNTAIGDHSLNLNNTGSYNSALGAYGLYSNTTGYENNAVGHGALYNITTGYDNSALGEVAGRYIADGSTANQTSNSSLYLGSYTRALANGDTNEIVIGPSSIGLGSNTVVLGNSSITTTALRGNVGIGLTNPSAKLHILDSTTSSGNVVNATASAITSGNILKLGQSGTTAFSGNGLLMDFNSYGGGSFSGNYLKFTNNGSTQFTVGATGTTSAAGVYTGTSGTNLRLQATGSTAGDGNNASIYALDSSGNTSARVDTALSTSNDLTVPSGTTTINSTASQITPTVNSGQAVVTVSSTNGFFPGNTVVLIQMLGTGVGQYEEALVKSVDSTTQMTLNANLTNTYTANGTTSMAQVIKFPIYKTVTVNSGGTLTASAFSTATGTGGVLYFKANAVTVNAGGIIDMGGRGFAGGSAGTLGTGGSGGTSGGTGGSNGGAGGTAIGPGAGGSGTASTEGGNATGSTQGDGGGGGGSGGGGAGGVFGAAGSNATAGGAGGAGATSGAGGGGAAGGAGSASSTYGAADFSTTNGALYAGSGGGGGSGGAGGGGADTDTGTAGNGGNGGAGGAGGAGGGIIAIFAGTITNSGTIQSNGAAGAAGANGSIGGSGTGGSNSGGGGGGGSGGAGGGGSGGSVWLNAPTVTPGTITATGGALGDNTVASVSGGGGGGCHSTSTAGGGGGAGGNTVGAFGGTGCSNSASPGAGGNSETRGDGTAGTNGRIKCDNSSGTCSGGSQTPAIGSGETQTTSPTISGPSGQLFVGNIDATGNILAEGLFTGGGSSGLKIDGSGNVGIGTASPAQKLTLMGSANQELVVNTDFVSGSAGSGLYLGTISNSGNVNSQIQAFSTGNTLGTNLLLDPYGGNVGIGTVSPNGKLTIANNIATGFLDTYAEYQQILYDGGTASSSYGFGIKGNTLVFNSGTGAYSFDQAGTHTALSIDTSGNMTVLGDAIVSLGSVSSPGIQFVGNTNSGIYSLSPNIAVAVNGAISLQIGTTNIVSSDHFLPQASATYNLGATGNRWGCLWYNNSSLGACASDARLKKNIQPLDYGDALSKIVNLNPKTFVFRDDPDNQLTLGLIAQEVLPIAPELVTMGSDGYYKVDYGQIGWLVFKGVQQEQAEIQNLQNDLSLTYTGDLNIAPDSTGNYNVTNTTTNTVINRMAALAKLVAANIKAGAITTQDFATNSFTAIQGQIDNLIAKNIQTKLISPIPGGKDVTVQIGSATESGKFAIQNSTGTQVAAIDDQGNATFSGVVHSQNIDAIQALLNQVSTDQSILLAATSGANLSATGSASLAQIITSDLYVTNQAAINSLSVSNTFTLGTDMVFGSGGNTINSLSAPLQIQSLAMAPVEIMNGLVSIDTHGNVTIGGDLAVAGKITTPDLEAGIVNATGSGTFNSVTTPQLVVAASDATAAGDIVNGVITTNSTIGQAVIPAGTSEITIKNPKVTDYTLVYVTPTSSTQNNVLYVKSKQAGQFVVGFITPINTDVNFNWWVVQVTQ